MPWFISALALRSRELKEELDVRMTHVSELRGFSDV